MADPILQKFLDDSNIDDSKKQGLLRAIEAGEDEKALSSYVQNKYYSGAVSTPAELLPTQATISEAPEAPQGQTFMQKAGESAKEQVTTGLIGKGLGRAESAVESFKEPGILSKIKGAGKTVESGLQIAGGAVQEVFNQGLNAAGSVLKTGLEQLDAETIATLKAATEMPGNKLKEFASNATVQKAGSYLKENFEKIPQNLRSDAEAIINLIPFKIGTKNIAITKKGAEALKKETLGKAEKLASEILKPGKYDEFAVDAFIKNAKNAKTYKEVVDNLSGALKTTGAKLEEALKTNKGLFKDERLKNAADFVINDLKSNKILATLPARAEKIKELEALSRGLGAKGKGVSLADVQRLKRQIDDSFSLYSKSGEVKAADVSKALAPERKYVKEFIERQAPNAKSLNTEYEGLREAHELATTRARQYGNDASPDPTILGKIRDVIPVIRRVETAQPSKLKMEASELGAKTSKIQALKKSAEKTTSIQEYLPDLKSKLAPITKLIKKK